MQLINLPSTSEIRYYTYQIHHARPNHVPLKAGGLTNHQCHMTVKSLLWRAINIGSARMRVNEIMRPAYQYDGCRVWGMHIFVSYLRFLPLICTVSVSLASHHFSVPNIPQFYAEISIREQNLVLLLVCTSFAMLRPADRPAAGDKREENNQKANQSARLR